MNTTNYKGLESAPGIYKESARPTLKELENRLPPDFREQFTKNFTEKTKGDKQIVVYADGCYDMFHFGHAYQLKQIKNIYPNLKLVIGVCNDADVIKNKGHGIMDEKERVETVKHCRYVDDIIFPAPWVPTLEFMDEKGIDFIAHDTIPYDCPGIDDVYLPMKQAGRFIATMRTEGISTSDLLTRILKDREEYYERNLKKGISRKEMNLNLPHYAFIQLKGALNNLQKCLKKAEYDENLEEHEQEVEEQDKKLDNKEAKKEEAKQEGKQQDEA